METLDYKTVSNQEEIIAILKQNSVEWVDLDDKEKTAKDALKAISGRKKELNDSIMQGLDQIDKQEVLLKRGGKLKFCTTTTFAPLKKEDIFNALKTELDDEARARTIMDKLYDREARDSKKVTTLKRLKR